MSYGVTEENRSEAEKMVEEIYRELIIAYFKNNHRIFNLEELINQKYGNPRKL